MSKNIIEFNRLDHILRKYSYFLFFIFTFFPFISIIDLGTDMQPYGLVMALILFFSFKNIKFTVVQFYLLLIFIFSIFIFFGSGINFASTRSLFNYMQLFFVSFVGYQILKTERINFEFFLKSTIVVWLLVGFIQTFINNSFLTFLTRDPRFLGETRGAVSLAAEPTFYGIVLLFFILFLFHSNYKYKVFFVFISLFGIIFFAKSSMVFLFLIIMIFFYFLTHLSIRSLFYMIILLLVIPFLILELMPTSRMAYLISETLSETLSETSQGNLFIDLSVIDRVYHIFFSLKGFYDNFMLPNGFLSWQPFMSSQIEKYSSLGIISPDYVNHPARAKGSRIMSGYGSAFFELGIISLLIPFGLIKLYYSLYKNDLKKFFFFSLFVNAIMFSGIPIGFSIFAFYIGFLIYLIQKRKYSVK